MGKPTGFIEYQRQIPSDRSPQDRLKDWDEFHLHLNESEMKDQGARCMDCGTPFCHTGIVLNQMASGCPVNNLIPEWNDLIYKGDWAEAYYRLAKTNNFPEFTGRVCPAPCESSCVLGINEPPVTIKNNEVTIVEKAFEAGLVTPHQVEDKTNFKIAVVGSGPAGLACADELCKKGHRVTVFERADRIGGLLMYGIPNMKLSKQKVVDRRVEIMKQSGIEFKTGVFIGKDLSLEELKKNYDSIVLCCGATQARDLPIDGREAQGVHLAMDFLTQNTKSLLDSNHKDQAFISAQGKDVIVIGGGDTGTDCVATSLRHECKSVIQLEIMDKPPLERADDNLWPEYRKTYFLDYGQEEAAARFGGDPRQYNSLTKKMIADENGNIKEIHITTVCWNKGKNGSTSFKELPDTLTILPTQLVLLALGFTGPEQEIIQQFGLKTDDRSNVQAEFGKFNTNVEGIFVAGDMRRGQSLVVWAINEGRVAAEKCDMFLRKKNNTSSF